MGYLWVYGVYIYIYIYVYMYICIYVYIYMYMYRYITYGYEYGFPMGTRCVRTHARDGPRGGKMVTATATVRSALCHVHTQAVPVAIPAATDALVWLPTSSLHSCGRLWARRRRRRRPTARQATTAAACRRCWRRRRRRATRRAWRWHCACRLGRPLQTHLVYAELPMRPSIDVE
jgi:hypothetical protein